MPDHPEPSDDLLDQRDGVDPNDLSKLADFFPPCDIEWKPGAVTRDRKKGLAMPYITNRAIMQRLDDVCGPHNWRDEFKAGPEGGVLCGISILVRRTGIAEWVTKWDGADNTEVEAVKGGLSNAEKRAGSKWGIGRYLYQMPSQWVPLNEKGRFAEVPRIPVQFQPRPENPPASQNRRSTSARRDRRDNSLPASPPPATAPSEAAPADESAETIEQAKTNTVLTQSEGKRLIELATAKDVPQAQFTAILSFFRDDDGHIDSGRWDEIVQAIEEYPESIERLKQEIEASTSEGSPTEGSEVSA